jgi:uncharacterized protein YdhG (YjbR/CyaY superfamily)
VDPAVTAYIEAIVPEFREIFDRVHAQILEACPAAVVTLSYGLPTYTVGNSRLHLGVWAHGVSIYGWKRRGDGGFTQRHPELQSSTGTIRLRPADAAAIADDELRALARAALSTTT